MSAVESIRYVAGAGGWFDGDGVRGLCTLVVFTPPTRHSNGSQGRGTLLWPPPAPSRAVGGPRLPVLSRAPRRRPAPRTVSTGDPRHEAPRSLLPPRRGREVPPCTLTHWHTGSDSRVIRIRTAYHQPDFPGLAGGVPPQEGASVPQPAGTYNLVSPSPAPPRLAPADTRSEALCTAPDSRSSLSAVCGPGVSLLLRLHPPW